MIPGLLTFSVLCITSLLIKKKAKSKEIVKRIILVEFLTGLVPCRVINWKVNTWVTFDHLMALITSI